MTDTIPVDQYRYLEYHANCFAGLVLVPPDKLRETFFDYVEEAQEKGIDFDEPGTGAREVVEEQIAIDFEVSAEVIHKRIEADKLWHSE